MASTYSYPSYNPNQRWDYSKYQQSDRLQQAQQNADQSAAQMRQQTQSQYKPSEMVQQAQQQYQQTQQQKPGQYTSNYQSQLSDLLNNITNRQPFKYDLNGDMLYNSMKDMYVQNGQQAMMDTMGQAQAMTGGYGNSYAQGAGQQAYQQYLTQLNAQIPALYDRAYQRWGDEGNRLVQNYNLLQNADDTDYGRWYDQMSQWNTDMDRGLRAYSTLYDMDYGQYQDQWNRYAQQAAQDQALYQDQRNYETDQYNQDRAFDRSAYESDRNFDWNRYNTDRNFDWDVYTNTRDFDEAQRQWQSTFDEGVRQYDQNFNRAAYESDRDFDRNVYENDRNYDRSVLENDRGYYNSLVNYMLQQGKWPSPDVLAKAGLTDADLEPILGPRPSADALDPSNEIMQMMMDKFGEGARFGSVSGSDSSGTGGQLWDSYRDRDGNWIGDDHTVRGYYNSNGVWIGNVSESDAKKNGTIPAGEGSYARNIKSLAKTRPGVTPGSNNRNKKSKKTPDLTVDTSNLTRNAHLYNFLADTGNGNGQNAMDAYEDNILPWKTRN